MTETKPVLTHPKNVFLYYPQRVIFLVNALLNVAFLALDTPSQVQTALNLVALGFMVFFYGEKYTHSVQHIRDVRASESQ